MFRFVLNRLFGAMIVLWIIVTLSFIMLRFAPGSPFDAERALPPAVAANKWISYGLGEALLSPVDGRLETVDGLHIGADFEEGTRIAIIEAADGSRHDVVMPIGGTLVALYFDDGDTVKAGDRVAVTPMPMWKQYVSAMSNYARGDFGVTISSDGQRTVAENLALGLPRSLELGFWALLVSLLLGVSAGLYAGLKQNTWGDYTVMTLSMFGISVPTIVSGPIFILIFCFGVNGLTADWFGFRLFEYGGWDSWRHKLLPVMTLALVYTAYFARLTRGGMLEVIRSDYIRTARAKGLDERRVVTRHALKGAILPTVTFLGPAVARLVTGSIVVERVFGIPGLAEYFVTPAINRDYPMVIGVVVLYSALLVVMNLLVDIAYTVLDPRVSYD